MIHNFHDAPLFVTFAKPKSENSQVSAPDAPDVDIPEPIRKAVSALSPPSTLLALCSSANAERLSALHKRLAEIDTEIEEQRTKRNAAARRLVMLAGKERPRMAERDNTVAFPVFQRVAK